MISEGNHKEALLQCVEEKRPLFHRPLEELKIPILFMGSKQDEMCRSDLENEYQEMASILPNASYIFFQVEVTLLLPPTQRKLLS